MEYKHHIFNPYFGGLPVVCAMFESDGWMLYNVINVNQYESVAVFVRPIEAKKPDPEEPEHTGDYL